MKIITSGKATGLAVMAALLFLGPIPVQQTMAAEINTSLARSLAPSGVLRVAINLGNGVLAQQNPDTGELGGISIMLSQAIAEAFSLDVRFITYGSAGQAFTDAANNVWDLGFMGLEPERATLVDFTRPYVYIEGTYLVKADAPYRSVADVDATGITIAAGNRSAYELYLSRNIERAELIRQPTSALAIAYFLAGNTDVVAGVRQTLQDAARGRDDLRLLDDSFMQIAQAMAVPADRADAVTDFLNEYIEQRIVSGFIRAGLDATQQYGAIVPGP